MSGTVTIEYGNIETITADCIVNAANSGLRRGSGVCGAIFAAAGEGEMGEGSGHASGEAVREMGDPRRGAVHLPAGRAGNAPLGLCERFGDRPGEGMPVGRFPAYQQRRVQRRAYGLRNPVELRSLRRPRLAGGAPGQPGGRALHLPRPQPDRRGGKDAGLAPAGKGSLTPLGLAHR